MDTLIYGSYVVVFGGIIRAFDGRVLNGMAFLPNEQYRLLLSFLLGTLYLCLGWAYIELIQVIDAPSLGLSVAWIGLSWWLIEKHLKSPDAQDHAYAWTGNHLLLSGAFFLLLWLEKVMTQSHTF